MHSLHVTSFTALINGSYYPLLYVIVEQYAPPVKIQSFWLGLCMTIREFQYSEYGGCAVDEMKIQAGYQQFPNIHK